MKLKLWLGRHARAAPFAAGTLPIMGVLLIAASSPAGPDSQGAAAAPAQACATDNGGITLPGGFCATVFADHVGHARHLVVAPDGVVYVNTWSGTYYDNDTPHAGGVLVALQDTRGDGHADRVTRFGETQEQGGTGGTGIALYN